LFILAFIGAAHFIQAAHLAGGQITWEYLGNNQYKFRLALYRNCSAGPFFPAPTSLSSNSPAGTITMNYVTASNITPDCGNPSAGVPCAVLSNPQAVSGVEKIIYESAVITLSGTPPAGGWEFSHSVCCRSINNENLVTPASAYSYVNSKIYNVNGAPFAGNSAQWEHDNFFLSLGEGYFNGKAIHEAIIDSVYYDWVPSMTTASSLVNYKSGYTANSPLPDNTEFSTNTGVSLDNETGLFSYEIDSATLVTSGKYSSYTYSYRVRGWQDGQLAYENIWDGVIYFTSAGSNSMPVAEIDTSSFDLNRQGNIYTKKIYVGDSVFFEIAAQDFDLTPPAMGQNVTFNVSSSLLDTAAFPSTAEKPLISPVAPQTGFVGFITNNVAFSWQPNSSNLIGNSHKDYYFYFTMEDDACPIPFQNISVVHYRLVKPSTISGGSDTIISCSGRNPYINTSTANPAWFPASMVNDSTSSNPYLTATASGYLYLTDVQYGGLDSVYIKVVDDTFNISDNGTFIELIDSVGVDTLSWYHNGIPFNHPHDTLHPFADGYYHIIGKTDEGCVFESDSVYISNTQKVAIVDPNNGSATTSPVQIPGSIGFSFDLNIAVGYNFRSVSLVGLTNGSGKKVGKDSLRISFYDDYNQTMLFQKEILPTSLQGGVIDIPVNFTTGPGNYTFYLEADSSIAMYLMDNVTTPYMASQNYIPVNVTSLLQGPADTVPSLPGNYLPDVIFDVTIYGDLDENSSSLAKVYPNPVSSIITVDAKKNIEEISLSDLSGKNIKIDWEENNTSYTADMSNLPAGIYVLKITDGVTITTKKVVKQ